MIEQTDRAALNTQADTTDCRLGTISRLPIAAIQTAQVVNSICETEQYMATGTAEQIRLRNHIYYEFMHHALYFVANQMSAWG